MAVIPPSYSDLGKSARDLFNKGFNYGFYKLEVKTRTNSGVEFTTNGSSNHENAKVGGSLETKYKVNKHKLTFTEKWTTDNVLATEVSVEDQLAKGLKVTLDTNFAPQSGKKSGKLKTDYKREYLHVNTDVDLDLSGPTVLGSAVLGYQGWLLGTQLSFNTGKSELTKSNFAAGYNGGDFLINCNVDNGSEFGGSIYHRAADDLEVGAQMNWSAGSNATKFGIAAKYVPERGSIFRAKVNNAAQVGLSYQQKLKDGLDLSLSTLVEAKNFSAGGHKVGLGLNFEL